MTTGYDAIVVGAGHNGLCNAAFLGQSGLKVLVLERNPHIGGAAVDVFEPEAASVAALSARIRAEFDPKGILNPGRMG